MLFVKARQLWMEPVKAVSDRIGVLLAQSTLLSAEISIKAQDATEEVALR